MFKTNTRNCALMAALSTGLIFSSVFRTEIANAASDTADALATVIAAIAIAQASDLDFGEGVQGDSTKVVAASTSENSENASFNISVEGIRAYTITLPGSATMITAGGGTADKEIVVNTFTSFPSGTGALSVGGTQLLLVGGTRAALASNQMAGSYAGTFTVTVVY